MTPVMGWTLLLTAGVAAWWLTGRARTYALHREMVDVPNTRSSHSVATPRGGGGAIVLVTTVVLSWWWWTGSTGALSPVVLAASLIVAAVGFADDHRHVPPALRLAMHFLAAGLAVYGVGAPAWGVPQTALIVVGIVWLINLTNFMDGIDGIAGAQTMTVCVGGAVLSAVVLPGSAMWLEPAVLASATAGFLVWNWPPARIFMGDVGSGYLGFMTAVLSLRALSAAPALGWSWLILSGVFIADASITLLRRAMRRERVVEAHRSHAYQRLAHKWRSHQAVTLLVGGVNVIWLMPLAWMVAIQQMSEWVGLALAYGPLLASAVVLGSGRPSDHP
jgi:Fuc2NAc and GlcNAc transferase